MKPLPSLSFLIPAYNDETTIVRAVEEAVRVGNQVADRFEILVTNDGSPDRTGAILDTLCETVPTLSVAHHPVNRGYGATIRELYYKGSCTWLFTIPGDYQIGAKELLKLVAYRQHADMIIGWRRNRNDPPARLRQSWVYNTLLRVMFGVHLHDINSVRLVRSSIIKKVKLAGFSAFVDAELTVRAVRAGFRVIEVPIVHRKRKASGAGGGSLRIILPTIMEMVRFALGLL